MVAIPNWSRSILTGALRPASRSSPSSCGSDARNTPYASATSPRTSTAHAMPMYFNRLSECHFEDHHGVGAALDAGQLPLGENHQIVALHQLQLEQPREQRPVQIVRRGGPGDIEDHRIHPPIKRDPPAG